MRREHRTAAAAAAVLVAASAAACHRGGDRATLDDVEVRLDAAEVRRAALARRIAALAAAIAPAEHVRDLERADDELAAAASELEAADAALEALEARLQGMSTAGTGRRYPHADLVYAIPVAGAPSIGPADAAVTIAVAFDFNCSRCEAAVHLAEDQLGRYPDDVRVVYMHNGYRDSTPAMAACAAHRQGRYLPMATRLWRHLWRDTGGGPRYQATAESTAELEELAVDAGLDSAMFVVELSGDDCRADLQAQREVFHRVGARGVPLFFVNGRYLRSYSAADVETLVDEELAKARERIEAGADPATYYERYVVRRGRKAP